MPFYHINYFTQRLVPAKTALKFCFKTCVAMKFVDDDDDDENTTKTVLIL